MAFLTLNGNTVTIAEGGEESREIIGGGVKRSHTGRPMADMRTIKRKWRFVTPPMAEQQAQSLIGLVEGRGICLPFDTDWDGAATNGQSPTAEVATQHRGYAADGGRVYDMTLATMDYAGSDNEDLSFGASFAVEPATTNVLYSIATNGPNICSGSDSLGTTGGFTLVSGTSLNTTSVAYWQGSKSVVFDVAANGNEFRTENATVAANATVTASVYLKVSNVAQTPAIRIYQGAGFATLATSSAVTFSSTTEWCRLTLTATLTGGNTLVAMGVVSGGGGATGDIYCDGFQIEELGYATSWCQTQHTGAVAGSRAAGNLTYTIDTTYDDVSFGGWIYGPTSGPSTQADLLTVYHSGTVYVKLYRAASTNNIVLTDGTNTITYATSVWANTWRHIMCVIRKSPETGENTMTLYHNGSSVGTAASTHWAVTSYAGGMQFLVGSYGAGSNTAISHRFDDIRCVPYAMTSTEVSNRYSIAPSLSGRIPKIIVGGDVLRVTQGFSLGATVEAIGEVNSVHYKPHYFNGAWRPNGRIVEFTLYEV